MILTDYFRYPRDMTWDYARQLGVTQGTIRLPETADFDITDESHWAAVCRDFEAFGIKPASTSARSASTSWRISAGPGHAGTSPNGAALRSRASPCGNSPRIPFP